MFYFEYNMTELFFSLFSPCFAYLILFFQSTELNSESMSSLKSIAQQAVVNAGLENQIPPSSSSIETVSISTDSRGKMTAVCIEENSHVNMKR